MRIFFLMFLPILAIPVAAQGEFETDADAELVTVVSSFGDTSEGPQPENLLGELSLSGGAKYLMQNGVEISGRATFRAQVDHADRPGFAGAISTCPPSDTFCPSVAGAGVRGGFSRIGSVQSAEDTGGRGSLETAYIAIDGGWGELILGRDQGVAQRFYEGGPEVFSLARSSSPILDPTGISIARSRNDISSTAEKISYVTPRILGVRAGLSYTPDASVRRLDLDTAYSTPGIAEPELGEAYEAGLQASRYLRDADLRVRGSLTWSKAAADTPVYADVETVAAGLDIERSDKFRFGISVLDSSNGGLGDYQNLSAGASYWIGDWEFALSGDRSEDQTLDLDGWSATVGVSREVNENLEFSLGYRKAETDIPVAGQMGQNTLDRDGVLLEVRIHK